MKNDRQKKILEIIRNIMRSEERKQHDPNLETGASSWFTTLPIKEEGYIPNKQSFWVLLSIRYCWRMKRILSYCACGNTFNLQHALQCPKGGFETLCCISEMISVKRKENYAFIVFWVRRKISFALANSLCTCLVDMSTSLQTHPQRIRCLHLQRLAKLRQMLMQFYYPFEFHILHTLHATTALNLIH